LVALRRLDCLFAPTKPQNRFLFEGL
jgi:hypothetical protein